MTTTTHNVDSLAVLTLDEIFQLAQSGEIEFSLAQLAIAKQKEIAVQQASASAAGGVNIKVGPSGLIVVNGGGLASCTMSAAGWRLLYSDQVKTKVLAFCFNRDDVGANQAEWMKANPDKAKEILSAGGYKAWAKSGRGKRS